jgi:hypothetical protein
MLDSASRERVSTKALIEENGYSIVEINNAGDNPLSPCPMGAKLENQFSVAVLGKVPTWMWVIRIMQEHLSRVTITCMLRLALIP